MKSTSSQPRNPSHAQHRSLGRGERTLASPKSRKFLPLAGDASPPSFFGQRPKEPWKRAAVPPLRLHTHTRATSARPCSLVSPGGGAKLSSSTVRGWGVRTANRALAATHWLGSALPRDASHYVTRSSHPLKKKQFFSEWFPAANRKRIIWRFLIGPL